MPKPLNKPQPSSSVANMLDLGVGAAALAKPPKREHTPLTPVANEIPPQPTLVVSAMAGEAANLHRQFILTTSTEETLKKLITIYSKATGIDLKGSEILRSILIALEHASPELEREATRIGRLKRPKNEKGNELLREKMERKIAGAIISGARAAKVLED